MLAQEKEAALEQLQVERKKLDVELKQIKEGHGVEMRELHQKLEEERDRWVGVCKQVVGEANPIYFDSCYVFSAGWLALKSSLSVR